MLVFKNAFLCLLFFNMMQQSADTFVSDKKTITAMLQYKNNPGDRSGFGVKILLWLELGSQVGVCYDGISMSQNYPPIDGPILIKLCRNITYGSVGANMHIVFTNILYKQTIM